MYFFSLRQGQAWSLRFVAVLLFFVLCFVSKSENYPFHFGHSADEAELHLSFFLPKSLPRQGNLFMV